MLYIFPRLIILVRYSLIASIRFPLAPNVYSRTAGRNILKSSSCNSPYKFDLPTYLLNHSLTHSLTEWCLFADCYQWTSYADQNSLYATNYRQFRNLADCLAFCLSNPLCVAVDFENASPAPCWVHTSSVDLQPGNTYLLAGRTQYILNRGCSSSGLYSSIR